MDYHNLTLSYAYLGDLAASADAAQFALTYARRALDPESEQSSLARLGWVHHLTGHLDPARAAFQQAETMLGQTDPGTKYLYSLNGIQHADHLRRVGQMDHARQVAEANWKICQRNSWRDDLSCSHRVLGDLDADAGQHNCARQHYDTALQIARNIYVQRVLIEALLARGRWAARLGDIAAARSNLEEALNCAVSGGYRLYEPDIRIGLAWWHPSRKSSSGKTRGRARETHERGDGLLLGTARCGGGA
jgi:tetratricopeptide (TPR) repeat protein